MAMSLTEPVIGSTGWGAAVNLNFATLEDFCNNVESALLNAVPVMTPPSPGDGVKGLVPAPGSGDSPNFLGGDGEWRQAGGPWGVVPVMEGDHGAGGAAGLVPAQIVGDANRFLRGDATLVDVVLVPVGNTVGDMLAWGSYGWQLVPRGQDGQVLTLSGGFPVWQ